MELIHTSNSPEQTEQLAALIGKNLKGGEVIELISDLGGGKTTFVRGLVKGAGSHDRVASPTFTISKVYTTKYLTIHHFDFYRLADPGVVEYELTDNVSEPDIVTVIEWPTIVENSLPLKKLTIEFKLGEKESDRQLIFHYPKSLSYLVPQNANSNY